MSENGISRARFAPAPAALLCLSALASACGSDDPRVKSTPEPYPGFSPVAPQRPVPGCETLDVSPCDTQHRTCQLSRLELAACLRQTPPGDLPNVTVMTEQEYVAYMNGLSAGRQAPSPNHFERAMVWLGLAEPGSFDLVPLDTESVADWFGTYRWRQKDLLIIDHGKPSDDALSNVELVAALIRALRDRDIDIGAWSTVISVFDLDSSWGADALYFGEARFYSNRYKAALEGRDAARFDELTHINDGIREDVDWIRAQPSSYVATNDRFPYNFGARLAYLAWRRDGVGAVNSLFDVKVFTHQLMASEMAEGTAPALLYHPRPSAPSQWLQDPTITAIGAWGLFLSLGAKLVTEEAWAVALTWRGDQLYVYKGFDDGEDTALVWQLEVADEAAASALELALISGAPSADVRRSGTFVTLAMSSNQDPLDWAFVSD